MSLRGPGLRDAGRRKRPGLGCPAKLTALDATLVLAKPGPHPSYSSFSPFNFSPFLLLHGLCGCRQAPRRSEAASQAQGRGGGAVSLAWPGSAPGPRSELVQFAALGQQRHGHSVEEVAQHEEQGTGQGPDTEQGGHEEGQKQREQRPVAAQEAQAEPRAPGTAGRVPARHGAQQVPACQPGLREVVATKAAEEVGPGTQGCHLACKLGRRQRRGAWARVGLHAHPASPRGRPPPGTHPVVDGGRQSEEHADQAGDLVAPDGLQLRVPLVFDVKPPQPINDLEAGREASPRGDPGQAGRCVSGVVSAARAAGVTGDGRGPPGRGPYLVPAQGCEDEPVLSHDAVRGLLLPVLISRCPRGECEPGELGLTELSGRERSEDAALLPFTCRVTGGRGFIPGGVTSQLRATPPRAGRGRGGVGANTREGAARTARTRNIWHRYSSAFSRYSSVLRTLSWPISSRSLAG